MAKVRVYEMAKELGLNSKQLLTRLKADGVLVRSASSTLSAPVVRRLRQARTGPDVDPPGQGATPVPGQPRSSLPVTPNDVATSMRRRRRQATVKQGGIVVVTTCDGQRHPAQPLPPGRILAVTGCSCGAELHSPELIAHLNPPPPSPALVPEPSATAPTQIPPRTSPDARTSAKNMGRRERLWSLREIAAGADVSLETARELWVRPPQHHWPLLGQQLLPRDVARRSHKAQFIPDAQARAAIAWLQNRQSRQPNHRPAPIRPSPKPPVVTNASTATERITTAQLARELHVTVYQLQTCARFDGEHLLGSSMVPDRLVDKYRSMGGPGVLEVIQPPTARPREDDDSPPTAPAAPTRLPQEPASSRPNTPTTPLLQAAGSLDRAEVVAIRHRLHTTPPAGHGDAVKTTRTRTMYWVSPAAQAELTQIPSPSGPPMELSLPAGLLVFTEPVDPAGQPGRGSIRGLSWAFPEHSPLVDVYRWHDTAAHGALHPDVFCRFDPTGAWPVLTGDQGDTVALLARCWELIHRPRQVTQNLPTQASPSPSSGRVRDPLLQQGQQTPPAEVVFRSVVFSSRSRRSAQRAHAQAVSDGRQVRAHTVRPHLRRRPGELIPTIPVARHTRGGFTSTGRTPRKDRQAPVTVYLIEADASRTV